MILNMENLTARYRLSAEQCRRRADAAADEVGKATWLRFAEEWLKPCEQQSPEALDAIQKADVDKWPIVKAANIKGERGRLRLCVESVSRCFQRSS
jgi:hypothetical protein